jgi:hypothetical protein
MSHFLAHMGDLCVNQTFIASTRRSPPRLQGREVGQIGSGGASDSPSSLTQRRLYWSGISPHPSTAAAPRV